jgi:hypothetical protein
MRLGRIAGIGIAVALRGRSGAGRWGASRRPGGDRVRKPGGRTVFVTHGLSDDPRVRRWQWKFNLIRWLMGGGCRLDLVSALVAGQPVADLVVARFQRGRVPRTHGTM